MSQELKSTMTEKVQLGGQRERRSGNVCGIVLRPGHEWSRNLFFYYEQRGCNFQEVIIMYKEVPEPISQNQDLQEIRKYRESTEVCKGSGLFQKYHSCWSLGRSPGKARLCRRRAVC